MKLSRTKKELYDKLSSMEPSDARTIYNRYIDRERIAAKDKGIVGSIAAAIAGAGVGYKASDIATAMFPEYISDKKTANIVGLAAGAGAGIGARQYLIKKAQKEALEEIDTMNKIINKDYSDSFDSLI